MDSYAETLEYLYSLERFGMKFRLEQMKQVLEYLGRPDLTFRSILVGGTNGKGSTAAMIAAILQQAGIRTGLYTSPHLERFTERIQINSIPIPEKEVVQGVAALRALEAHHSTLKLTYFEYVTALALGYFAAQKTEVAVLEVGLGGTLDATNAVDAEVSVITNVDLDHQAILGNTHTEIAREKGGIIKPGKPVVTAETKEEVLAVFREMAESRNAPLVRVFPWTGKSLSLQGGYQRLNAGCAVAAVQHLPGFTIQSAHIDRGLASAFIPGRMEKVRDHPVVIMDIAHNPAGAKALANALQTEYPGKKVIWVWGMSEGKEYGGMAAELGPLAKRIIVSKARYRGASMETLRKEAEKYVSKVDCIPTVTDAYAVARREAEEGDIVLVAGSVFLIGEARSPDKVVHSM